MMPPRQDSILTDYQDSSDWAKRRDNDAMQGCAQRSSATNIGHSMLVSFGPI
jgi:hypothetical protein